MIDENIFEQKWFEEKNQSVSEFINYIKKVPAVLKKYKFEKHQSEIISKLLRSNMSFWSEVEEGTMVSRKKEVFIKNITEEVNTLTLKLIKEKAEEEPNQNLIEMLTDELDYIKLNFNPETNQLTVYNEVNKQYEDTELVYFFVNYAETIDTFLENNNTDGFVKFSKDELFVEYVAKLFAFNINGIGVGFKDNQIVLSVGVEEDGDMDAIRKLNE